MVIVTQKVLIFGFISCCWRFRPVKSCFLAIRSLLPLPGLSANFDDTAPNAVSSRLSGLKRLGNFFVFPLMTNAVFAR